MQYEVDKLADIFALKILLKRTVNALEAFKTINQ